MNEFAPSNKMILSSLGILLTGLTLAAIGFSIDLVALGVFGSSIVGFSVVLVFRLFWAKRNKEFAKEIAVSQKDERQIKIYIHAGNMAFWISLFAIIGLSILTRTKDPVLLFFPSILLFIYLCCALYFNRKF